MKAHPLENSCGHCGIHSLQESPSDMEEYEIPTHLSQCLPVPHASTSHWPNPNQKPGCKGTYVMQLIEVSILYVEKGIEWWKFHLEMEHMTEINQYTNNKTSASAFLDLHSSLQFIAHKLVGVLSVKTQGNQHFGSVGKAI